MRFKKRKAIQANFQILSCTYEDPLGFFAAYLYKKMNKEYKEISKK